MTQSSKKKDNGIHVMRSKWIRVCVVECDRLYLEPLAVTPANVVPASLGNDSLLSSFDR